MYKLLNFPMKKIKEGSTEIFIPTEKKISKKLPVFYNPIMKLNRDITILLLKQFPPMRLCDPLAGTGIRAIRFAKELKYKSITINDNNKKAVGLIKKNMRLNKVKFEVKNEEANLMLLKLKGFDFIDLDVFGSPNFILDSAIKRLARDGILAVTATDTACLCGTAPKACLRKYWAMPKRDSMMHETGLRILIRKIQLIGAQYEKALTSIFSFSKDHYFRIFFQNKKGKKQVDEIVKKHGMFNNAGPLWQGQLFDKILIKNILKDIKKNKYLNSDKELVKFLKIIEQESKIDTIGFFDIHKLCKKYKLKIPKKQLLIKKIKKKGYKASETHFNPNGIKSGIPLSKLLKIIKNF